MTHPKRLFIATVLAATGAIAVAQSPLTVAQAGPAAGEQTARPMMRDRGARMDSAQREQRRAEWHAQRMADLKAQLKLTPAQEGAWTAYTAPTHPPADAAWPRMNRDELSQLNTPQRIDRMQQLATERQTRMQQRGEAVKAFYAQLTPEQQKVYDERAMRGGKGGGMGGMGGMGGPGHRGMR